VTTPDFDGARPGAIHRRDFLKATGALGLSLSLFSLKDLAADAAPAARAEPVASPLRYG